ncbi:MAG: DNA adenine methylase [Microthrixaceae bacterium]|nr:DNA adenine methylase [Microthrixaceae bacterium]
MKAPFPWFGGKRKVATEVWSALGDVDNYVEPFAGSLAVLLERPTWHKGSTSTVNDADRFVSNFWRALAADPEGVAAHADWPVNEADLEARHLWLVTSGRERVNALASDPDFFDVKVAGWWVWGICSWIGSGWCAGSGPWMLDDDGRLSKRPHLGDAGQGINGDQTPAPPPRRRRAGDQPPAPPPRRRRAGDRGVPAWTGPGVAGRSGVLRRLVACRHERCTRLRVNCGCVPRPAVSG